MARVKGRIAIVTGGASGLGRATAARLVEEGALVTITDVNHDAGARAGDEIGAAFTPQDVTDETRWAALIAQVSERYGGLDILVNNAGIGDGMGTTTPETTTLELWRRVMAVNLDGVFLGCKHAIPVMARSGGGSIVNLSSIAALVATPFLTAYGVSKAGVRQLTMSVALHCAQAGYKVRCNSVHPGQIVTPMYETGIRDVAAGLGAPLKAVKAEFLKKIPLGEFGQPEDIANAVLYLASDEAKHVTGAQLVVDGGMELNP